MSIATWPMWMLAADWRAPYWQSDEPEPGLPFMWLGVIFAALGVLIAVRWLVAAIRRLRRRFHPVGLYLSIARELGLSVKDRWCLLRIARRQRLVSPLVLILSPATLDHHAELVAARLNVGSAWRLRHRVGRIRRQLFD